MIKEMFQKQRLESFYAKYNHREFVHPDPLEFLYRYQDLEDRELVGMVAAALAYGRVAQIINSVSIVLDLMGPSPYQFIRRSSAVQLESAFNGFVHRFATGKELSRLLMGINGVLDRYGSLYQAFRGFICPHHDTVLPSMSRFCRRIDEAAGGGIGHLLPMPDRGSACKRMNLFLRWMVRKDTVDPGGWEDIPAALLIVPLDVHMHRVGQKLGFTTRKQADIRTAMEITNGFKQLTPEDPVRYDFVLTRLGIRKDMCDQDFFS
jgi:uncharacterized protein (TIGR02757 family)